MNTASYVNTFIRISEDSPVTTSKAPELYRGKETVATLEYRLLHDHPYTLTQEDVQFQTYLLKNEISTTDEKALASLRTEFFSKPKACFRASPLPKNMAGDFITMKLARLRFMVPKQKHMHVFSQMKVFNS